MHVTNGVGGDDLPQRRDVSTAGGHELEATPAASRATFEHRDPA
jgi:hypothetical protein